MRAFPTKCIVFFMLCALSSSFAYAQVRNQNIASPSGNFFTRTGRSVPAQKVFDGHPYVNGNQFDIVKIKGYNDETPLLRYNGYLDEMEFMSDSTLFYINKQVNAEIVFPDLNKTYKIKKYSIEDRDHFGYLVLLTDVGHFHLYKREKVELLPGEVSPSGYGKDANDYYAKQKDLYLVASDDNFFKAPRNVKEAGLLFNVDLKVIQTYTKNNKLQFSREADLIKIVEHFSFIKE